MSYAQTGEDLLLLAAVNPEGRTPVIIEVGAFDGVTYSNSYLLEQNGWNCVLIEPNPTMWDKIESLRSAKLFKCGVGTNRGTAQLTFEAGREEYGTIEGQFQFPLYSPSEQVGAYNVDVQIETLDSICAQANVGVIDVLTVDVEGHELQVFGGFQLDKWKPHIIIVEDNTSFGDLRVHHHLGAHGYRLFRRTGVNNWYHSRDSGVEQSIAGALSLNLLRLKFALRRVSPKWALKLYRSLARLRRNPG